jgi:hypothetical protein
LRAEKWAARAKAVDYAQGRRGLCEDPEACPSPTRHVLTRLSGAGGYGDIRLSTAEAFYDKSLGQFILPYDAVREASDPFGCCWGF